MGRMHAGIVTSAGGMVRGPPHAGERPHLARTAQGPPHAGERPHPSYDRSCGPCAAARISSEMEKCMKYKGDSEAGLLAAEFLTVGANLNSSLARERVPTRLETGTPSHYGCRGPSLPAESESWSESPLTVEAAGPFPTRPGLGPKTP